MSTSAALTLDQFETLDEFLNSEIVPEDCMDISMLDGFLTALAIAPGGLEPNEWLDEVWGQEKEMIFPSPETAEEIVGLIQQHWAAIGRQLAEAPDVFEPLFYEHEIDGESFIEVDDWCIGFMRAVDLLPDVWDRVEQSDASEQLLPMRLFGTEAGWDELDNAEDEAEMHDEWSVKIAPAVIELYKFWRKRSH